MPCKLDQNNPPDLTGLFDVLSVTYGYVAKDGVVKEYTLDNPLIEKFQSSYTQKGIYITTYDLPKAPDARISYGLWKKVQNQGIIWECNYVTPDSDNTLYNLVPTKVCKNRVVNFTLYLYNSGFNNNPPNLQQTSYICKYEGVRIT